MKPCFETGQVALVPTGGAASKAIGAAEAAIDDATARIRARTLAAEEEGFARLGQEPDW